MNMTMRDIASWNRPNRFGQRLISSEILRALPEPGTTAEEKAEDHTVYAHFFCGSVDVWMVDLVEPETGVAFGFVRLAGMEDSAEWGYFSIPELLSVRVPPFGFPVERDLFWRPTPAKNIPAIAENIQRLAIAK